MRHRNTTFPALYLALLSILAGGCQREISGKYRAKFANGVYWLQLVRTPDNHLTGQLESSILGQDGKIARETVSVSGAVNGSNVTISATMFGLSVVTLSGSLDGNRLTLTGGQPSPMVLERADISDYQKQVNALNSQSQGTLAANAAARTRQRTAQTQQSFVSEIGRLVARMRQLDSEADVHLGRFPGAEDRYRAITSKMGEYLNKERQLAGRPDAGVARGQIVVAMNQASIATDQLHNAATSLESSVQANVQPVAREVKEFEQGCHAVVPPVTSHPPKWRHGMGPAVRSSPHRTRSARSSKLWYMAWRILSRCMHRSGRHRKGCCKLRNAWSEQRNEASARTS